MFKNFSTFDQVHEGSSSMRRACNYVWMAGLSSDQFQIGYMTRFDGEDGFIIDGIR